METVDKRANSQISEPRSLWIPAEDVLELLRVLRDERDDKVRAGLFIAAAILGVVVDEPQSP